MGDVAEARFARGSGTKRALPRGPSFRKRPGGKSRSTAATKRRLAEIAEEYADPDHIICNLGRMASQTLRPCYNDDGSLKPLSEWPGAAWEVLDEFESRPMKVDRDVSDGEVVRIRQAAGTARVNALELLAKYLGMLDSRRPHDDRQQTIKILRGLLEGRKRAAEVEVPPSAITVETFDAADWKVAEDRLSEQMLLALRRYEPPAPKPPPPSRLVVPMGRTEDGLHFALDQLGWRVRWNLRATRIEYLDETDPDAEWQIGDTLLTAHLRAQVAEHCVSRRSLPLRFTRQMWTDYTHAIGFWAQVDPFREWLEDLEPWDGIPRLDQWLGLLFKVSAGIDSKLVAWASRSPLLAAVWRAYRPGEPHHEMVVLVGPQRGGKSLAWASLVPPKRREWFTDALTFTADLRQRIDMLRNRVVVEAAEMAGSTTADVERIREFLTRSDDGTVKLACRRDPVQLPRRCVIVGTTNDPRCLPNDRTGNRRFVPIVVTGDPDVVRRELDENRHYLWAEALHRYRQGESARLPRELWPVQDALVKQHRAVGAVAARN